MPDQEVHLVLASADPVRIYAALFLAIGAKQAGAKRATIATCLLGRGAGSTWDFVRKGGAESITLPGAPPLSGFINDALQAGVEISACGPSKDFLRQAGVTPEVVEHGIGIEDMEAFLTRAMEAARSGGLVLFI
jgi:predicted peroxiredoxin